MRGWFIGLAVTVAALSTGEVTAQERVTPLNDATPVIPQLTPLDAPPVSKAPPPTFVAPAKPAAASAKPAKRAETRSKRLWTTASVTVRSGPSADTGAIDELTPGTAVTLAGPHGEWSRVRMAGGIGGFIRTRYLTAQPPAVVACENPPTGDAGPDVAAGTVVAPVTAAYLRVGAGCGEHTLDVLEAGERVTVLGTSGDWYAVTGQGWERGYVSRALVRPATE